MKLQLDLNYNNNVTKINYKNNLLFIGSCFTENIYKKLKQLKFKTKSNFSGILFDTKSIITNLNCYIENKQITDKDIFYHDELWKSWNHHSCFNNINLENCLQNINQSTNEAHKYLLISDYLFITIGSAYSYYYINNNIFVANCHKVQQNKFEKKLIKSNEISNDFKQIFEKVLKYNPKIKIILNVSPVRHIRDGVVENNRSKANILEAVHNLLEYLPNNIFYFPSYEIIIDILRDYRFYDIDLVHPNYLATEIVFEYFINNLCDEETKIYIKEILPLINSLQHKPINNETLKHKDFLKALDNNINIFLKKYPSVSF